MKKHKIITTLILLIIIGAFSVIPTFAIDLSTYEVKTQWNMNGFAINTAGSRPTDYYSWERDNFQGIRVSVYNYATKQKIGKSFDIHRSKPSGTIYSSMTSNGDLGCKIEYMNGKKTFKINDNYNSGSLPSGTLPLVFWTGSNIATLKSALKNNAHIVAQKVGLEFGNPNDERDRNNPGCLVYKNYTVVFEPVVYVKYIGKNYALTHYEISLFSAYYRADHPNAGQNRINTLTKGYDAIILSYYNARVKIQNSYYMSSSDQEAAYAQINAEVAKVEAQQKVAVAEPFYYPEKAFYTLRTSTIPWAVFFDSNTDITKSFSNIIGPRSEVTAFSTGQKITKDRILYKNFGLGFLNILGEISLKISDETYEYLTNKKVETDFDITSSRLITSDEGLDIKITASQSVKWSDGTTGTTKTFKNLTVAKGTSTKFFTWTTPSSPTTVKFTVSATGPASATGHITCNIKEPPLKIKIPSKTYTYTTSTNVITSFNIESVGDIVPSQDLDIKVIANKPIMKDGKKITEITFKDVVVKGGEPQIKWFEWTTPDDPTTVTFKFEAYSKGKKLTSTQATLGTINCTIKEVIENIPPDPGPYDKMPKNYDFPTGDKNPTTLDDCYTNNSWSEWVYTGGKFVENKYVAKVKATMEIQPDERCKTRREIYNGWKMGSGYGINCDIGVSYSVFKNGTYSDSSIDGRLTGTPIAETFFPEFQYKGPTEYAKGWGEQEYCYSKNKIDTPAYNRILVPSYYSGKDSDMIKGFNFEINPHSHFDRPVHFTPLNYPDGNYDLRAIVHSVWSPAGEIKVYLSDRIIIAGAVYDDYYVGPLRD